MTLCELVCAIAMLSFSFLSPLRFVLYEPAFVIWHPTIAFGGFAVILLASLVLRERGVLYIVWGSLLEQDVVFWRHLTVATAGFYAILAILNIIVSHAIPLTTWLHVKTFAPIVLLALFSLFMSGYWRSRSKEPFAN